MHEIADIRNLERPKSRERKDLFACPSCPYEIFGQSPGLTGERFTAICPLPPLSVAPPPPSMRCRPQNAWAAPCTPSFAAPLGHSELRTRWCLRQLWTEEGTRAVTNPMCEYNTSNAAQVGPLLPDSCAVHGRLQALQNVIHRRNEVPQPPIPTT